MTEIVGIGEAADRPPVLMLGDHGFVVMEGEGRLTRRVLGRNLTWGMRRGEPVECRGKGRVDVLAPDGAWLSYEIDGSPSGRFDRLVDKWATGVATIGVVGVATMAVWVATTPVVTGLFMDKPTVAQSQILYRKVIEETKGGTLGFSQLDFGPKDETDQVRRILKEIKESVRSLEEAR